MGQMDPDHAVKLTAIHELMENLPAAEKPVFHLNPKIGSCGEQAAVVTPGNIQKRPGKVRTRSSPHLPRIRRSFDVNSRGCPPSVLRSNFSLTVAGS